MTENLYELEYRRQHPKRKHTLLLRLISIIIAALIVVFVSIQAQAAATPTTYSEISISAEEYDLLKRIVAAESQTQSLEGRMAVAEVIFNRVLNKDYPDTVKGVLSQKGQFTSYRHRNDGWVVPELSEEAIQAVINNGCTVLPDTGYVFFSRGKSSFGKDYIKIQDHWFGRAKR